VTAATTAATQLHARAAAGFDATVRQIRDNQWALPTPCAEWNVHALVNHVVGQARWTAPLLDGQTIAQVGDRLDGDLLGPDPRASWTAAYDEAVDAADRAQSEERFVHLSFGDTPAEEYLRQLAADYLIHSWDLAVAVGAPDRLDPDLVEAVAGWFDARAASYRDAAAVAEPVAFAAGDDPQQRLLAEFGRDRQRCVTLAAIARFGAAFDRHDVDAVMAAMTDDCVFESTAPPDGARYVGQTAVRAAWTEFFEAAPNAVFETEDQIACGDRVVACWLYRWPDGHVRGIDVYRVRDGLVAEKRSYVKG
jgi:uncharacterized protein (TIGR03086 family)